MNIEAKTPRRVLHLNATLYADDSAFISLSLSLSKSDLITGTRFSFQDKSNVLPNRKRTDLSHPWKQICEIYRQIQIPWNLPCPWPLQQNWHGSKDPAISKKCNALGKALFRNCKISLHIHYHLYVSSSGDAILEPSPASKSKVSKSSTAAASANDWHHNAPKSAETYIWIHQLYFLTCIQYVPCFGRFLFHFLFDKTK